jgi:cytidylate kinase
MIDQQRSLAHGRNMVCEGRDQGTVVFPNAICKFYFAADLDERARRRLHELHERGHEATFTDVRESIRHRDEQDSSDETGRRPAHDAHWIDTTGKSPENVLDEMEEYVRQCSNSLAHCSTSSSTGLSAS